MGERSVTVNRAAVLTLWAAVVAVRLGYRWEEALSLGRAVAGLNAQTKGRRLGIFTPAKGGEGKKPKKVGLGEDLWVEICGRAVPAKRTERGVRAVVGATPIDPAKVESYLESKFGERLQAVRDAMQELAASLGRKDLAEEAFALYEQFRPQIAPGARGWGQKGVLDLGVIRSLTR